MWWIYFLQQLRIHEIKGIFLYVSLKAGSEAEFPISLETLLQSWLALYVMLSKPNFLLGYRSTIGGHVVNFYV